MNHINPTGLVGASVVLAIAACSTVPPGLPPGMPGAPTTQPATGSSSVSPVPTLPPAPVASASAPAGMPTPTPTPAATATPTPPMPALPASGDKKLTVSFASSTVKVGQYAPGVVDLDPKEWIPQSGKFTLMGRVLADGRWKAISQEYTGNPPRKIFFEVEPVWTSGEVTGYFTVAGPNGDLTVVATAKYIAEATASTSPSPAPTATPAATPAPTPTPAPTATPTPAPTPSPSPTGGGGGL